MWLWQLTCTPTKQFAGSHVRVFLKNFFFFYYSCYENWISFPVGKFKSQIILMVTWSSFGWQPLLKTLAFHSSANSSCRPKSRGREREPARIRALNHHVAPNSCELPPRHSGLLPSVCDWTSLSPLGVSRPVINMSSTWQRGPICCYCHTAKFGPGAQSSRLEENQLNQQSLIPASVDSFIKGLISVSSCLPQPNHFPTALVSCDSEAEIRNLPTPPETSENIIFLNQINTIIR